MDVRSCPSLVGHSGHAPSPKRGDEDRASMVAGCMPTAQTHWFEDPAHWNDWGCWAQLWRAEATELQVCAWELGADVLPSSLNRWYILQHVKQLKPSDSAHVSTVLAAISWIPPGVCRSGWRESWAVKYKGYLRHSVAGIALQFLSLSSCSSHVWVLTVFNCMADLLNVSPGVTHNTFIFRIRGY